MKIAPNKISASSSLFKKYFNIFILEKTSPSLNLKTNLGIHYNLNSEMRKE